MRAISTARDFLLADTDLIFFAGLLNDQAMDQIVKNLRDHSGLVTLTDDLRHE